MTYQFHPNWSSLFDPSFYLFPQFFPQVPMADGHRHPSLPMVHHREHQLGPKYGINDRQKLTVSTSPTPSTPSFFIENILNDRLKTVSPDSTSSLFKDVCNKTNGKQSLSLSRKQELLLTTVSVTQGGGGEWKERRGEKRNHSEMMTGSDMDTLAHGPHARMTKVPKLLDALQQQDQRRDNCHHHDSLGHPLLKGSSIRCPFSPTTSTPNTASSSSSPPLLSPSPSASSSMPSPSSLHHRGDEQEEEERGIFSSSSSSSCEGGDGKTMKCHNLNIGNKSKRIRTIFKAEQLEKLEMEFTQQQYMVGPERQALATSLNLTEAQVKVWFQNRRIKWRKQNEEENKRRMVTFQPGTGSESEEQQHQQQSSPLDMNRNASTGSPHLVFNFH